MQPKEVLSFCVNCPNDVPTNTQEFGIMYHGRIKVINDPESFGLTAEETRVADSSTRRKLAGLDGIALQDFVKSRYLRLVTLFLIAGLKEHGYWDEPIKCEECPNKPRLQEIALQI